MRIRRELVIVRIRSAEPFPKSSQPGRIDHSTGDITFADMKTIGDMMESPYRADLRLEVLYGFNGNELVKLLRRRSGIRVTLELVIDEDIEDIKDTDSGGSAGT